MQRRAGAAQEELRRANLGALLARVHLRGPTSRAVLTRTMGLNRSTIGDLTAQLDALGLVSEEVPGGEGAATGRRSGRPSLVVTPRADVTVLAIVLEVDRITVALVGLGGTILERRTRGHHRGEHDVAHVLVSLAQMAREVLAAAAPGRCLAAGVSVPGAVRTPDGLVRFAPNLGWFDEPFAQPLTAELGLPVYADNDANLGVLAEHLRGAATGLDEVAYVNGSVGIGGGFLVGGRPLRGGSGYAGEVGHLMVDREGSRCRCGARGCWETKVGENQLLTRAGRLPGGGPAAVAEVIEAAAAGEPRAEESLTAVAEWVGVGLCAVVNLFNPDVVVLGGVLAQVWTARQDQVRATLVGGALVAPREEVVVRAAELGQDSALVGAAELAFAPLLADPLGVAPSTTLPTTDTATGTPGVRSRSLPTR